MSASAREVIRKLLAEHHTSAAERALREDQEGADRILAALSAAGFVVVPREPTEEMLKTAHDGPLMAGDHEMGTKQREWLSGMWSAMLSAAEGKK